MGKANFKKIGWISILLWISTNSGIIYAQDPFEDYKREAFRQFEEYKTVKNNEFEAYRKRVNKEFAEYMSQAWPEFNSEPAIPAPSVPEPPEPVIAPDDKQLSNEAIPFSKITPVTEFPERPIPVIPEEDRSISDKTSLPATEPVEPDTDMISFNYYGEKCEVPFNSALRFSLAGSDEHSVAKAWHQLANDESVATVKSCINLRDRMRLPDWGYIELTEKLAKSIFPNKRNESTLLQMFLLTQSGYKVRIGRCGDNLILLVPSEEIIYNYTHIPIDGTKYYVITRSGGSGGAHVYNRDFPGERMFSLRIYEQPELKIDSTDPKHFVSAFNSSIDLDVSLNKNLIDFYNSYPLSNHWNIYADASLSDKVKGQLYPVLKEAINGKDQVAAANILLHFVQTAFEYKIDQEQFGFERPFFPDEIFFYPFSDCEDRAILYSVLVRDLLGLDVVLVHYPGHLATAVRFNDDVTGDHFNIEGRKYTVCDPTYINSNVGMAMSSLKDTPAEIVKL